MIKPTENFLYIFCRPIPPRRPVHIVVGRPIDVERNLKASAEEVVYICMLVKFISHVTHDN